MKGMEMIRGIGKSYRSWEYDLLVGLQATATVMTAVGGMREATPYFAAATMATIGYPMLPYAYDKAGKGIKYLKSKFGSKL